MTVLTFYAGTYASKCSVGANGCLSRRTCTLVSAPEREPSLIRSRYYKTKNSAIDTTSTFHTLYIEALVRCQASKARECQGMEGTAPSIDLSKVRYIIFTRFATLVHIRPEIQYTIQDRHGWEIIDVSARAEVGRGRAIAPSEWREQESKSPRAACLLYAKMLVRVQRRPVFWGAL